MINSQGIPLRVDALLIMIATGASVASWKILLAPDAYVVFPDSVEVTALSAAKAIASRFATATSHVIPPPFVDFLFRAVCELRAARMQRESSEYVSNRNDRATIAHINAGKKKPPAWGGFDLS